MRNLIITIIISAAVACGIGYSFGLLSSSPQTAAAQESVYDRVIKSGKIRCGYIVYPPSTIKDPNTGAISGFSADIINKLAGDLGLKVEWTEETGSGSMVESLNSNRFDVLCTSIWTSSPRGKVIKFSAPLYYTAINAYARKDDLRFMDNEKAFDREDIRISTVDGDIAGQIAREDAPKAKLYSLPDLTDFTHLLLAVKDNKADLTFAEAMQVARFQEQNPNVLRNVTPDNPVRIFANGFAIKSGEDRLADMIDNAIRNIQNNGFIERVLAKHAFVGAQRLVAKPYR